MEYASDTRYLVGIPEQYISMPNRQLRRINLLRCWLPLKVTFDRMFPKDVTFFDAHQFYRGESFQKFLEPSLRGKKVFVVTRRYNIDLMIEAGMPDRLDVTFVEIPDKYTFAIFDQVVDDIMARVEDVENTRVLLSAGPASKALVYELSLRGLISYDLGTGIEAVYRPNMIEATI